MRWYSSRGKHLWSLNHTNVCCWVSSLQLIDVLRQALSLRCNTNVYVHTNILWNGKSYKYQKNANQTWLNRQALKKHFYFLLSWFFLYLKHFLNCFDLMTCWGVKNSAWVEKQTEIKGFQWWEQSVNFSVKGENKEWEISSKSLKTLDTKSIFEQCNLQFS